MSYEHESDLAPDLLWDIFRRVRHFDNRIRDLERWSYAK